jgi:uncharacterized membrane protein YqgA involved in biofilm formation
VAGAGRRLIFFVSFGAVARHNRPVETTIGAFLNAIGILLGALIGLARRKRFSLPVQLLFRNAIGAFNLFFALRLIYKSLGGTALSCLMQICIALVAIIVGFWLGKLLGLQKISNRLGRGAGNTIALAQKKPRGNTAEGFNACAILFLAEPLGIVGAVVCGLSGFFYLLAVKAVMDALVMADLVKIFRWPSALSAVPVFVFFSAISLAVQLYLKPLLTTPEQNAINIAAGLIALIVTIVIFEVRKVGLANYLPALIIAPLLAKLFS